MPCRRATRLTVTPGSWVSATIANFSAGVLRRRRSGPFRTSLFRLLLVINTTLLLPLIEVGERVRSIKGPLQLQYAQMATPENRLETYFPLRPLPDRRRSLRPNWTR